MVKVSEQSPADWQSMPCTNPISPVTVFDSEVVSVVVLFVAVDWSEGFPQATNVVIIAKVTVMRVVIRFKAGFLHRLFDAC